MRTTLNIDAPILNDLKAIQADEHKSLGRVVSDLLLIAIKQRQSAAQTETKFAWTAKPMSALVDIADTDALYDAKNQDPS